uniref:Uncharacterized protein n=1 Tax=Panagrolaimus sp. ES5 TaxID=591445 RepID=A0AC34GKR7_9BILA
MDDTNINSSFPGEIQKLTLSNTDSSAMPQKSESTALIASMEEKLDQAGDTVSSTLVSNTKNQTDNAPFKNQDEKTMDEMIGQLQEADDEFNDGEPSAEQNGAIHGFHQSMLNYITDAANPKLSLKLMKASKDFCFAHFPYFPIKRLQIAENDEIDGIEW